jgi:integrase
MSRVMSRLIAPENGRTVWKLRLKPPGFAREVAISTRCVRRNNAERFKARVDVLIEARANGDPVPSQLSQWVEALDPKTAKRLIELRLLDRPRFEQAKPIETHIADWQKAVAARRHNTAAYAQAVARYVRKVCRELKVDYFPQLTKHEVQVTIDAWPVAPNTKRKYLMAIRDLAAWMKRDKRAQVDPLADLPIPPPQREGTIRRRAMTVDEFRYLLGHLVHLQKKGGWYDDQRAGWTAEDRRIIYWTAVSTGYRLGELASLRRYQLFLNEDPPCIDIHAADAKNRTAGSVPIPAELAEALKAYIATLHPATQVFPIPGQRKRVIDFFRKDLAAARAAWLSEEGLSDETRDARAKANFLLDEHVTGRLDFHALRHTAITWWLTEFKLPAKAVQILARLRTLALVDNYSRAFRLDGFAWLSAAPRIADAAAAKDETKAG